MLRTGVALVVLLLVLSSQRVYAESSPSIRCEKLRGKEMVISCTTRLDNPKKSGILNCDVEVDVSMKLPSGDIVHKFHHEHIFTTNSYYSFTTDFTFDNPGELRSVTKVESRIKKCYNE
jgi:hypothetical protein